MENCFEVYDADGVRIEESESEVYYKDKVTETDLIKRKIALFKESEYYTDNCMFFWEPSYTFDGERIMYANMYIRVGDTWIETCNVELMTVAKLPERLFTIVNNYIYIIEELL